MADPFYIYIVELRRLRNAEQLNLKCQGSVSWYLVPNCLVAIRQSRRNDQLAGSAHTHSLQTFFPTLDDPSCSNGDLERLGAVAGRVKLGAVFPGTDIGDGDG